ETATNSGHVTVETGGVLSAATGSLDNFGLLDIFGSASLDHETATNSGTVDVESGGVLTVTSGSLDNHGLLDIKGTGQALIHSASVADEGTIKVDPAGPLTLDAAPLTIASGALLDIYGSASLDHETATNSGH